MALWLFMVSVTWRGHLVAVAIMLGFCSLVLWGLLGLRKIVKAGFWRWPTFLAGMALFVMVLAWLMVPALPTGNYQQVALKGELPGRFSTAVLVPEVDQLLMGCTLFSLVDRYFSGVQATSLADDIKVIYGEMREDARFRRRRCLLGSCYREIFLSDRSDSVLTIYRPHGSSEREPQKVIVFLHGSLAISY